MSSIFPAGGMEAVKWSLLRGQVIALEDMMIKKKPLIIERVRKISGSFAWIPHVFLRKGFWAGLTHHELLLYLFLTLVADRQGMSYYSFDKICSFLAISVDEYIAARNSLIDKDLIAFDGLLFQVLSLPAEVTAKQLTPLRSKAEMKRRDPATITRLIHKSLANDE